MTATADDTVLEAILRRDRQVVVAALIVVIAMAWLWILLGAGTGMQQRQLSYEELAFHLEDSASFRAFARLPLAWSPRKSVLHQTISAIRPSTSRRKAGRAVELTPAPDARRERIDDGD